MPLLTTSDGATIHYELFDFQAPWTAEPALPIILAHGFARSMKWWTTWIPALAARHPVVAYDVRGCGESKVPTGTPRWAFDRLVQDAVELLDNLSITRVHWVGFESGGMQGLHAALRFPNLISSLVLVNAPPRINTQIRTTGALGYTDSLVAMRALGFSEYLRRTLDGRLDLSRSSPELVAWQLEEQGKTPIDVAVGLRSVFLGVDLYDSLPRVEQPVLLINGERSRLCPPDQQTAMASQFPNARAEAIPDVGEGVFLLESDRCADLTLEFLAETTGPMRGGR